MNGTFYFRLDITMDRNRGLILIFRKFLKAVKATKMQTAPGMFPGTFL